MSQRIQALDTVLLAMRRDLMLDTQDSQFDLRSDKGGHFTSKGLFDRKVEKKEVVEVVEGIKNNPANPPPT